MRTIDAEKFYKQTAELEAEALAYVKKLDPRKDYEKWIRWTVVLTERTAFKHDVADAPTIDAEPVKHGKWIDPAAEDCYRCSVCEEYTLMEMPRLLYHYCPHCGADMVEAEQLRRSYLRCFSLS